MSIAETKDGTFLSIFVKPNSPKFKIVFDVEEITIYATEETVKGKVNKEIIKELTKMLHTKVEIASGATSKQKKVLLRDIDKQKVQEILQQINK